MAGPRSYSNQTLKLLFGRSGNICSFPGCNEVMASEKNAKNANICHIEGANIGSERYNPNMSNAARADYPNLILLCVQHHDETNNVSNYPKETLYKMKRDHEAEQTNLRVAKNPSMLSNTIQAIASMSDADLTRKTIPKSFNPKDKIAHNNLKRNGYLIQSYKLYHASIDSLYDTLEEEGSIKRLSLLNHINLAYIKIRSKYQEQYPSDDSFIQNNADEIFDDVCQLLQNELKGHALWSEDIQIGVTIIAVDAFIRCKILEAPGS